MSWNGTVRCGHCYKTGHNKRGCPQLKKHIAENPDSWEAKHGAGRARQCSYCDQPGHTRRTCEPRKTHESLFRADNLLWRQAFQKWALANGLGYGALITAPLSWRDAKGDHVDGAKKPALGMFIAHSREAEGNALTYDWAAFRAHRGYNALTMQLIGAEPGFQGRAPCTALQLPDIPVIAPANGKDHWGYERTRDSGDATWSIVSPSPRPGFGDDFTSLQTIEDLAKEHFKSG